MTTIKHYFTLQLTMLRRQLTDFGINPILGCIIIVIGFLGFSVFLFNKSEYAKYLYILVSLSLMFNYSKIDRNDFLKFIFSEVNYFKIRVLENLLVATPFIIFLCFKKEIYSMFLLIILSIFITLFNSKRSFTLVLPTPFYRRPFEFIAGFRNSIIAIFFAYFITAMAIIYQNLNLGIFSLLFIFLVCLSFYNEPENVFYVWIHKLKVNGFLFDKIKTAIIFSSLITMPVVIGLLVFFKTNLLLILGVQLLGYGYLLTVILAKYSTFPQKMNLPQALLLALSITMPPILLGLVPFFYLQSQKKLKEILE